MIIARFFDYFGEWILPFFTYPSQLFFGDY
jgi:hypothetical protein